MRIQCIKMGINGEGIGYDVNRKPIFCTGVLPNETAEVTIIEDHDTYAKAECNRIVTPSPDRVEPEGETECECGFPLMAMSYPKQLSCKQQLLEQSLWKYAHLKRSLIRDIKASPDTLAYRSECKLPFGEARRHLAVGLYRPGTNHFAPVSHFATHTEELETVREQVMQILERRHFSSYDPKTRHGLRTLVLRVIDHQAQCTLVTGKDTIRPDTLDELMTIEGMKTVAQSINTEKKNPRLFGSTKVLAGDETIEINLSGLKLSLSVESFFQLNVPQAAALYQMAVDKIDPCDTLVEAYCGIGTMSLLASKKAKQIIGMESVKDAVKNAKLNAENNGITNVRFIAEDAGQGLKKILAEQNVDTLLVDPPRSGMDDAMINAILDSKIKKIVYVSCDPATLGKNINLLKKHYDVRTVIPFDMFPDTPHVESLTVLERRGGE
ncbi:MAG: 23S rRNA (uracil(1939)-C(5))-methyltransferase RlmD [Solobacterium sp.]|nr:23S rRNA (uracil(1939)-C(5))-methyltransferase RlmD [Solobacterium sp.]MCH4223193.1 23S rRNA (uracil(1939)-C(5))-methyltransferase RlmD [Solobacterium sp.]MCH4266401.1 23S rRNA (uracil(1939)-C(5))-methyltransferase RlmD [Solobacterium sp.]